MGEWGNSIVLVVIGLALIPIIGVPLFTWLGFKYSKLFFGLAILCAWPAVMFFKSRYFP